MQGPELVLELIVVKLFVAVLLGSDFRRRNAHFRLSSSCNRICFSCFSCPIRLIHWIRGLEVLCRHQTLVES